MADLPPPVSLEDDDSYIHTKEEVEEMKQRFLRQVARARMTAISEMQAARDEVQDESDGSVNSEIEYQKEMEEQRIADEKNGHFVRDRDLAAFISRRETETARLVSENSRVSVTALDSPNQTRVPIVERLNLDALRKDDEAPVSFETTVEHGERGSDCSRVEGARIRGHVATNRGSLEPIGLERSEIFGDPTRDLNQSKSTPLMHAVSHQLEENSVSYSIGDSLGDAERSRKKDGEIFGSHAPCSSGFDPGSGPAAALRPSGLAPPALDVQPISMQPVVDAAILDLLEAQPLALTFRDPEPIPGIFLPTPCQFLRLPPSPVTPTPYPAQLPRPKKPLTHAQKSISPLLNPTHSSPSPPKI